MRQGLLLQERVAQLPVVAQTPGSPTGPVPPPIPPLPEEFFLEQGRLSQGVEGEPCPQPQGACPHCCPPQGEAKGRQPHSQLQLSPSCSHIPTRSKHTRAVVMSFIAGWLGSLWRGLTSLVKQVLSVAHPAVARAFIERDGCSQVGKSQGEGVGTQVQWPR